MRPLRARAPWPLATPFGTLVNQLFDWGFGPTFLSQLDPSEVSDNPPIGRVTFVAYGLCSLAPSGRATLSGALRDAPPTERPVVGDWVRVGPGGVVTAVLERQSLLVRRDPNEFGIQPLAANVDTVFITTSANQDLNARRFERFVALVRGAGIEPVIVVSKADLAPDLAGAVAALTASASGAAIVTTDALHGDVAALAPWLGRGRTVAFIGASGVGKSTLVNAIFGEEVAATRAIREDDDRGRHTTTDRRLHRAPDGTVLVDLPGVREVGLVGDEALTDDAFPELAALFARCRWRSCAHGDEDGCAVTAALADGTLAPDRWAAWKKLERERIWAQRQVDPGVDRAERERWRKRQAEGRAGARLRDRNRW